jgi:hypothetical protein
MGPLTIGTDLAAPVICLSAPAAVRGVPKGV